MQHGDARKADARVRPPSEIGVDGRIYRLVHISIYRLGSNGTNLLERDALSAVRLRLEFLKLDLLLQDEEAGSTVIVFGSACVAPSRASEFVAGHLAENTKTN